MKSAFLPICVLAGLLTLAGAQSSYDEPWRPQYHFTPDHYFMNDPNGLVFYKGEYHLFYQYNPEGNVWGHMSWGHAVSTDMLHWKHLPVAIPEVPGKYMIYSGSVVVDRENSSGLCIRHGNDRSCLVAIFTAAAKNAEGQEHQAQHLAYSNDRGRTWKEYERNPVSDLHALDFRDPKVFWYAPQKKWVMVAVLADERRLEIFSSSDLKRWKRLSEFGPAGDQVGQWECPDLFELPVEGSAQKKWVLVVNRNPGAPAGGTGTRYIVGTFDGTRFTADSQEPLWADFGKDFYATHRYSSMPPDDDRTVWMGWIGNWQYANVEPTTLWRGAQSIPRELTLTKVGETLRLRQKPVAELKGLRAALLVDIADASPEEVNRQLHKLKVEGDALEIEIEFGWASFDEAGLILRKGATEETRLGFAGRAAFVDRTRSGEVAFSRDFPGTQSVSLSDFRRALHVFVDRASVEVFVNDGDAVITDRIYPSNQSRGVELIAGTARVEHLRVWRLNSVWAGGHE